MIKTMEIVSKQLNELTPYKNNPRKNDDAVEYVANSIREFGFKVPIVIDKDGVIVCGHTRYSAAKQLGLDAVPCVIADDLTDKQIKAFRLADNKVSEKADWDLGKLGEELDGLGDFEMSDFGFDIPEDKDDDEDDGGYYGDERQRTNDEYNLGAVDLERVAGFYQIPTLQPTSYIPDDLIGFNYVMSTDRRDAGVHFFIDDYQFRRCYERPTLYIEKLQEFPCVLTPDWSLYTDMPMAMKIYNVFRSRLFGQMCQDAGIQVIPTLQWADEDTFKFAFDGLPKHSTVAVSTVGVMKDKTAAEIWRAGMTEALKRLQPSTVILYGSEMPEFNYGKAKVKHIKARQFSESD